MPRTRRQYVCGFDAAVDIIGGKWKPLILWALRDEPHRFGALRRAIDGISEKMLIQQLREMERDGLVHREALQQVPPKVVYSLTPLGESLKDALMPLVEWGERHMAEIEADYRCHCGETAAAVAS